MSTQPRIEHVQEGVPEVIPPAVVDPPAPKKKYSWQPLDDQGNAVGGLQVIEYETPEELADKLRDQNIQLRRELMNKKREAESLKPLDPATVPAEAERLSEPKPLTDAERMQLSKDLFDPMKMESAYKRLQEATGETRADKNTRLLREAQEADTWAQVHPEYHVCDENNRQLLLWCRQRKLVINQANLDLGYKQLKEAGLLLEAPIAAEQERVETPPAARTDEGAGLPPQEPTPPPRRPESTSSGLTRRQMSAGGGTPAKRGLTWADVRKMSDAEFEKKLRTDPAFRKAVDALPPEGL